MDEIDIWRAAHLLIDTHGDDWEVVAARRIDLQIGRGDPAGEATWKRIREAARQLLREKPDGAAVN